MTGRRRAGEVTVIRSASGLVAGLALILLLSACDGGRVGGGYGGLHAAPRPTLFEPQAGVVCNVVEQTCYEAGTPSYRMTARHFGYPAAQRMAMYGPGAGGYGSSR
jgi:hypothetical protein